MVSIEDITSVVTQLEGPYKWYVLGIILVLLTAIMTKVIFKTFKWFFILTALAVIAVVILNLFWPIDIAWPAGEGSEIKADPGKTKSVGSEVVKEAVVETAD